MRTSHFVALFACVFLVAPGARADEAADAKKAADARAVVDKALKAHGGAEKLAKFKAAKWKGKGTVTALNMQFPFTGEWIVKLPDQMKWSIELNAGGNKATLINVIDGDKGWEKNGDVLNPLNDDRVALMREDLYADWVAWIVPLKDKEFKLTTTGEATIAGRPAVGVKVSREGRKDVTLYFDKENGLLVKSVNRTKEKPDAEEVEQEAEFFDYKEVGGILRPMQVTLKRKGLPFFEVEISEYKPLETVEADTFARP